MLHSDSDLPYLRAITLHDTWHRYSITSDTDGHVLVKGEKGSAPRRVVTSRGISHLRGILSAFRTFAGMIRTLVLALLCCSGIARAGDEIPGSPQRQPIFLKNATVHTVSHGTVAGTHVLFDKGRIVAIGDTLRVPANARVVDCTGMHVYPGFIAPVTTLGLTEIDAVRATRDMAEIGAVNPNVRGETAYNPDSELIPTIRSNGILLANVSPVGGLVSGMSSLMRLDGWTREDIAVRSRSALIINWPTMDVDRSPWNKTSAEEQRSASAKAVKQIYDLFHAARAYGTLTASGDSARRDIKLESIRKVLADSIPVMIHAESTRQIEAAIEFKRTFGIRLILVGASEARFVVDLLQRERVPLIINRVHGLPTRDEDPYDQAFTLPAVLAAAQIPFAFSDDGAWQQRNLAYHAGTAIAFGLSETEAERALSLYPARMFGIDGEYGSIEVGKSATLFVSTGVALDSKSAIVRHAFIDGREVDLSNRHVKLTKKYRERFAR